MKKLLLFISGAALIGLAGCSENTGMSATATKNLDAMHAISKMFESKDFSKVGDYIAADAVDHLPEGDVKGLDSIKAKFAMWASTSENDKSEIIKEMADDEYVMSWMRYTGVAKTADMGVKPGESYSMSAMEVAKFKDGKVVEHWSFMSPEAMKQMMGSMMPPPPMMPSDTSKMK